jgi:TolA-binding protein
VLWVQAGLTALLAVLFVAMLVQARQQGARIQELQERIQGLENSRALERTTGLEEQLRATVERLQAVERDSSRIDVLRAETDALRDQLRELSAAAPSGSPRRSPAPAPLAPGAGPGGESGAADGTRPDSAGSQALPGGSAQP